jgi:hypothetical protein
MAPLPYPRPSRRHLVALCALLLTGSVLLLGNNANPPANAIGPTSSFRVVLLRHRSKPGIGLNAAESFAHELKLRTSIDVSKTARTIDITLKALASQPFAILTSSGAFSFSQTERQALKRWLEFGGFLILDGGADGKNAKQFNKSVHREFGRMFPGNRFTKIPPQHVIFRSFYRLDYPAGRVIRKPYLEGLTIGRRYAVVYNQNDLLGAFARNPSGSYLHTPIPGRESQREMAYRLGVNFVMYALCLHYKDDQVHLEYLLHKRKWKVTPPR